MRLIFVLALGAFCGCATSTPGAKIATGYTELIYGVPMTIVGGGITGAAGLYGVGIYEEGKTGLVDKNTSTFENTALVSGLVIGGLTLAGGVYLVASGGGLLADGLDNEDRRLVAIDEDMRARPAPAAATIPTPATPAPAPDASR